VTFRYELNTLILNEIFMLGKWGVTALFSLGSCSSFSIASKASSSCSLVIMRSPFPLLFLGIEAAPTFCFFVPATSDSELVLALFPLDTLGAAATVAVLAPNSLA
jgi:hypothetical protein